MSEAVECVVIGAGVVGLACASALAEAGVDVIVLERHAVIGSETSSRNSEVIHAGIYYPTGSLKASLCVRGKALLYEYCEKNRVAHARCGKVIVASGEDQMSVLEGYKIQAAENGVGDLEWLDANQVRRLEPAVRCVAGLLSPSTGIIDSHGYMLSLQGRLEAAGGMIAFGSVVAEIRRDGVGFVVVVDDAPLGCRMLVNCAGLGAPQLARWLDPGAPTAYYARGHYFSYSGRSPFRRLVYPIAEPGGLGVHVTLDLAGQAKFGPDVEWCDGPDYRFDDRRKPAFAAAIRQYFPDLEVERLQPDYVGVRPKISAPGEPAADFRIDGPDRHGIPGLVHLLGIESPGLTASLAIAEQVRSDLLGHAA